MTVLVNVGLQKSRNRCILRTGGGCMPKPVSDAQKRATMKYDAKNTIQIHLKLNKKTDSILIDFLQTSGNVQGTIKAAIKEYMEKAAGK